MNKWIRSAWIGADASGPCEGLSVMFFTEEDAYFELAGYSEEPTSFDDPEYSEVW